MSIIYEGIVTTDGDTVKLTDKFRELLDKTPYFIDCSTVTGQIKAYDKCDVVRSIIGKDSSFIANLNVWALNDDGSENKTRLAKQEISKLNQPNPEEDRTIFFQKHNHEKKLHGKCYVRIVKGVGGEEFYYVIPGEFITPEYDNGVTLTFERKVKRWLINDRVSSYYLEPNEVFVFSDIVRSTDGYTIYGESRLKSLSEVISAYVTAWEVITELVGDRGAMNIISMGINDPTLMALPQTGAESDSFLQKLKNKYGTRRGKNKNIVTSLDAKVSPISAKISDMMLPEIIKDCKKAICNAFEIPPELIGVESSRFKTVPEARKEAYTQSAITSFERTLSQWRTMRNIQFTDFKLTPDFSHLDFYQEDKLKQAIAFQQMANAIAGVSEKLIEGKPIITWNQSQILLDLK